MTEFYEPQMEMEKVWTFYLTINTSEWQKEICRGLKSFQQSHWSLKTQDKCVELSISYL